MIFKLKSSHYSHNHLKMLVIFPILPTFFQEENGDILIIEGVFFLIWPLIIRAIILTIGLLGLLSTEDLKEKEEAYECGFDPFLKKKTRFCVRFFNIAILYLLIDLEISLLLPFFIKVGLLTKLRRQITLRILSLIFLLIFLLILEYIFGGLR